ncbi:hypothetical protein LEP1GSC193_2689 [Leptospira alstonii serovar Pingchang str. 80-412]|uniref:Uncharacterized protein n=3 Tax=Leptospira alstonii TaxID=28452 RepID=M6D6K0_9LEPT|nr:hypothetical protein [Leptospira alstonii]EMJ94185.1 hypothetical protein LEP1GSC194_0171 [Leptospira alstonii serovar Sichuan str. 79601]EQA79161.1 hypothetical protein LEP1GSC193_2689 [Leptospira alstonii serovar Pingchang str. 80-412]
MPIKVILNIFKRRLNFALPLRFSEEAVTAIRAHLVDRPESAFQVRIERKDGHTNVQVGYDRKKNLKTAHSYPVLVEIAEEDEICLEGSRIEWNRENNEFLIYPDVDLEIEYQIFLNRFKIRINRNVFKDDRTRTYANRSEFPDWFPIRAGELGISKVKIKGRIWTLTLVDRYKTKEILEIESSVADGILDYFSNFPVLRD